MSTLATPQLLNDLWEELAAPSAIAFARALAARGIRARVKDFQEFVASKSERQILSKGVKFTGKIVAHYEDDRWAADLINFTSRPATTADGIVMTQALFVQDLFTRFIWVRPMTLVKEVAQTFTDILEGSERRPRQLTVDKGVEFTAN